MPALSPFLGLAHQTDVGYRRGAAVRANRALPSQDDRPRPVCVGGRWARPPEDGGGPKAFLERRAAAPWRVEELLEGLREDLNAGDIARVQDRLEQLPPWQEWLLLDRFDRRAVNRRLRPYVQGDPGGMDP